MYTRRVCLNRRFIVYSQITDSEASEAVEHNMAPVTMQLMPLGDNCGHIAL